ncbi:hypothetical protein BJY01DRAFT_19589 [Aspergillus pseudoustus]|uniref:Uncharacterized protein n=1 Tax=Aspergillus pseudoustus TaxID=1810923 RepID=A0ABR4KRT1_9EURO
MRFRGYLRVLHDRYLRPWHARILRVNGECCALGEHWAETALFTHRDPPWTLGLNSGSVEFESLKSAFLCQFSNLHETRAEDRYEVSGNPVVLDNQHLSLFNIAGSIRNRNSSKAENYPRIGPYPSPSQIWGSHVISCEMRRKGSELSLIW